MSDFVIAQIRTYVPMGVGMLLSWLVAQGMLDEATSMEAVAAISAGLTAVLGGLYYFVVRMAAKRWPGVGVLLGYNKAPAYTEE